jgi:hypothetical protein
MAFHAVGTPIEQREKLLGGAAQVFPAASIFEAFRGVDPGAAPLIPHLHHGGRAACR